MAEPTKDEYEQAGVYLRAQEQAYLEYLSRKQGEGELPAEEQAYLEYLCWKRDGGERKDDLADFLRQRAEVRAEARAEASAAREKEHPGSDVDEDDVYRADEDDLLR
jgi:hypothetical protein